MADRMNFPPTFEEFIKEYEFKDEKEVYTNGDKLIPSFRVIQAWEHYTNNLGRISLNINRSVDNIYDCLTMIENNLPDILYEIENIENI